MVWHSGKPSSVYVEIICACAASGAVETAHCQLNAQESIQDIPARSGGGGGGGVIVGGE